MLVPPGVEESELQGLPGHLGIAGDQRLTGLDLRRIDNPPVVQYRTFDRETREIIREAPTTDRLRFLRAFREDAARYIGRHIDVQV
ncbi:MAG: hypothetical protein ACYTAF_02615 [Planctomycetota bacterium]|jgi:hypothetical protein